MLMDYAEEDEFEREMSEEDKDELCEGELEYALASWSEDEGKQRALKQRMEKADEQVPANRNSRPNHPH